MSRTGRKNSVVVGLGNILMGDEGIGVHVVRELERCTVVMDNVDVFEAGTSPMSMVHIIANRDRAVLIDCAFMGRSPGEIYRFSPEEVLSMKSTPGLSLHEGDILKSLEISRRIGECPEQVVILGIEPGRVFFGEGISRELQERMGEYVEACLKEIGARLDSRGRGLRDGSSLDLSATKSSTR